MRVTGLCGGIGAGKSTVAALLAERGAKVIDVDQIGRLVLEPHGRAYSSVVDLFGDEILAGDVDGQRSIDRGRLASIVFGDPAELKRLEGVSHPAINAELDEQLVRAARSGQHWVVLDMAVLVESKLGQDLASGHSYDTVLVVEASEERRVARLVEARGMAEADALARIRSQADDASRRSMADIVLFNDGDLDALVAAVAVLVPQLSRHRSSM